MPYKDPEKRKEAIKRFYQRNPTYDKKRYQNKKEIFKENRLKYKEKLKKWIFEFKSKNKCLKCGETDIKCLQFHHRDPKTKTFTISQMIGQQFKQEIILDEIRKCDILCLNCHMKIHHKKED